MNKTIQESSNYVHKENDTLKFYSNVKLLGWTGRNKNEQQRKQFQIYSELLNKKLTAMGLPISETFKTEIIEKSIALSNQVKRIMPVYRINLKSCFIAAAYFYIKDIIKSQFVDLKLITQVFEGFKISGKQLAKYLDFYKKNMQKTEELDMIGDIKAATIHILRIFVNRYENDCNVVSFIDNSHDLLNQIIEFSADMNVQVKSKKTKNVSIALAYILIRYHFNDSFQLSELISKIKESTDNTTNRTKHNELLPYSNFNINSHIESKLTGEIKYSSVFKLYNNIIGLLETYIYENCIRNLPNYTYLVRRKDKLKYAIVTLKRLIESKSLCNKTHFRLIINTAFKCKRFLEKREIFSRENTEQSDSITF